MPGFLSAENCEVNEIEAARQSAINAHGALIDLTDTSPTSNGLLFPKNILSDAFISYSLERNYLPDSKGLLSAREAIATYYNSRSNKISIAPEQIFLTASTSESYSLLFSLLSDAGDSFLAPAPSYPLFELLAMHSRVSLDYYSLRRKNSWRVSKEELVGKLSNRTRGLLVVSPHNPTGAVQRERLDFIADLEIPIIADEVFSEFVFTEKKCPPIGELYPELPVFHLNGISKMFALPDLKLGWIALNQNAYEQFGERLEHLNDLFLSANSFSQFLLPRLFKDGSQFVCQIRNHLRDNLKILTESLVNTTQISCILPEAGYNCLLVLEPHLDEIKIAIECIRQGVFVHPGYYYGCENEQCLIISLMPESEKFSQGVETIKQVVAKF